MFQFSGSNANPENQESHNALPNYYGQIRTLKKDYAAFKEGKTTNGENSEEKLKSENIKTASISFSDKNETAPAPSPFQMPAVTPGPSSDIQQAPSLSQQPIQEAHPLQPTDQRSEQILSSAQEPAPPLSGEKFEFSQKTSTFSDSQSHFAEDTSEIDLEKEVAKQGGMSGRFIAIATTLLVLIIGGAGFYYWWFFVKNNSPKAPAASEIATPQTSQPETKNENLRYLNIDASSGKADVQSSLKNLASSFLSTASDNDLIEVKLLGSDNQQLGVKEFIDNFGLTIPSALKEKFTDDYSLFIKDEGSEARTGAVFKLSGSADVAENLKQWEPTIIADLSSFYLSKKTINENMAFSSSRYKNADIRYYNFPSPNPGSLSLDYSFVTDNVSNYLIVGTSKETARSILDYLLK